MLNHLPATSLLRSVAVGASTLALFGATFAAATPSSAAEGNIYRNLQTFLCLDAEGGGGPGARVITWDCNNGANQRWQVGRDNKGRATLVNQANGLCLDREAVGSMGAKLIVWYCNNGWNQTFELHSNGYLENTFTYQVVDAPSTNPATQMIVWEKNNGDNQKWVRY